MARASTAAAGARLGGSLSTPWRSPRLHNAPLAAFASRQRSRPAKQTSDGNLTDFSLDELFAEPPVPHDSKPSTASGSDSAAIGSTAAAGTKPARKATVSRKRAGSGPTAPGAPQAGDASPVSEGKAGSAGADVAAPPRVGQPPIDREALKALVARKLAERQAAARLAGEAEEEDSDYDAPSATYSGASQGVAEQTAPVCATATDEGQLPSTLGAAGAAGSGSAGLSSALPGGTALEGDAAGAWPQAHLPAGRVASPAGAGPAAGRRPSTLFQTLQQQAPPAPASLAAELWAAQPAVAHTSNVYSDELSPAAGEVAAAAAAAVSNASGQDAGMVVGSTRRRRQERASGKISAFMEVAGPFTRS